MEKKSYVHVVGKIPWTVVDGGVGDLTTKDVK